MLSEALRPQPAAAVVRWLDVHFPACAISSLTVLELAAGLAQLPQGGRQALESAVSRMVRRFGARVYAFDRPAAYAAARLAGLNQMGAKLVDLQIGGIAAAYGLALATRNAAGFRYFGLELIDPWSAGS